MRRAGPRRESPRGTPPVPGDAIEELVRVLKFLSDEHRLRILFLLGTRGELHVSAISDALGRAQPAVSHHLGHLTRAGLVDRRRAGKFNFYALNPAGLRAFFRAGRFENPG